MDTRGLDRGRGALLCVCFVFCLGFAVVPEAAISGPEPGEAGSMYDPDTVVVIDLTLPPASIAALEGKPDEYQPGTFSLAFTDGSPDGMEPASAPMEVGIRLKGKYGSFKTLAGKAGFKLKLNFVKGKKFLGLKKMTLNNMVQDTSMIHEVLAYRAFRSVGVAAPRAGYAYVRVNGEAYGLYLNIETFDDVALERWFGPFDDPQHLYEGEYGTDVELADVGAFEVDEGDEEDRGDLEALISAVAGEGSPFSERVSGLADLKEMTRMWAVEKYIGHWDGYAGMQASLQPNNFYLFSGASGEFQMLPWGTDQTWAVPLAFDGAAGLLFEECLADPYCSALYWEALVEVGRAAAMLDLDSLARQAAERLEPWQQLTPDREAPDLGEIEAAVEETRNFIADRPGELAGWLSTHRFPRPEDVRPAENSSATAATAEVPKEPIERRDRGGLRVGRSTVAGGALTTRLRLPGAGALRQVATIDTARGAIVACATRVSAESARELTLRCYLSDAVRRRLYARWLRLEVETAFRSRAGSSEVVSHEVVARRVTPAGGRNRLR